jgi:hypothetical protein
MPEALVCYIVNVYPEGVKLCKLLDPLSRDIMKGGTGKDYLLDSTPGKFRSYVQAEEKERSDFRESWVSVESSFGSIGVLFS